MTELAAIPTLRTGRLTLCPPVMADFDAYAAFVTGPRTTWMGGLIIRHEDRAIGQVSLCAGPEFPEPELGWMIFDPANDGSGYATEAATAMRGWALRPRALPTIVSYIDPANAPSIRLAERLGATRDDTAPTPANMPTLVYRLVAA